MKDAKRGFVPSDEREFGDKTIPNLRQAADEVLFLLNHGYPGIKLRKTEAKDK